MIVSCNLKLLPFRFLIQLLGIRQMRLGKWRNLLGFEDLNILLSLLDWLVLFNVTSIFLFDALVFSSNVFFVIIGEEAET